MVSYNLYLSNPNVALFMYLLNSFSIPLDHLSYLLIILDLVLIIVISGNLRISVEVPSGTGHFDRTRGLMAGYLSNPSICETI